MPAARRGRQSAERTDSRSPTPAPAEADQHARRGRSKTAVAHSLEYNILLTATLCLLAVGAVMVYSASSAPSLLQGGSGAGSLIKFLLYGAIGLAVMRAFARRGLQVTRRLTGPLLALSFALVVAVHIPHVGVEVNGARRWLGAGPVQFQPAELMKLALVLYCAELLARRPKRTRSLRELFNPLLIVVGAAIVLVASQPDLGTAMVLAFTACAMLVAAGMPVRKLALLACIGLAVLGLYAAVQPYSRARLTSFIDPWSHAGTTGFQAVQGQIAIGSGGLFGRGPGQSVQKVYYLPEASTDFILAVIGEELGVVGVLGVLFLYGMIAFAGLRCAKRARNLHASLIALGVTALIVFQAILNAFAVLGLAPLTGVPLPFISYGSTNLIVMLAGMGMLLNVASGGRVALRAVKPRRGAVPVRAARVRVAPAGAARAAPAGAVRAGTAAARTGSRTRARDAASAEPARLSRAASADEDRDRRRRDRGARRAGAGGGRRATG